MAGILDILQKLMGGRAGQQLGGPTGMGTPGWNPNSQMPQMGMPPAGGPPQFPGMGGGGGFNPLQLIGMIGAMKGGPQAMGAFANATNERQQADRQFNLQVALEQMRQQGEDRRATQREEGATARTQIGEEGADRRLDRTILGNKEMAKIESDLKAKAAEKGFEYDQKLTNMQIEAQERALGRRMTFEEAQAVADREFRTQEAQKQRSFEAGQGAANRQTQEKIASMQSPDSIYRRIGDEFDPTAVEQGVQTGRYTRQAADAMIATELMRDANLAIISGDQKKLASVLVTIDNSNMSRQAKEELKATIEKALPPEQGESEPATTAGSVLGGLARWAAPLRKPPGPVTY